MDHHLHSLAGCELHKTKAARFLSALVRDDHGVYHASEPAEKLLELFERELLRESPHEYFTCLELRIAGVAIDWSFIQFCRLAINPFFPYHMDQSGYEVGCMCVVVGHKAEVASAFGSFVWFDHTIDNLPEL